MSAGRAMDDELPKVLTATNSASYRPSLEDCRYSENDYTDDDSISNSNMADNDFERSRNRVPPPLPPRQLQPSMSSSSSRSSPRRVPESPIVPPPIPPRERSSPLLQTSPCFNDDNGDEAWIRQRQQQQQLNRRPPPPFPASQWVNTPQPLSSSPPVGSRNSTEAPELVPRCRVQQQRSPDGRPIVTSSASSAVGSSVGVVIDVEGLVYNTGHLCRNCCGNVIAAGAGADLMVLTTTPWRNQSPSVDCTRRLDPNTTSHHRRPVAPRSFLTAAVVASPSSLTSSRTLSPTSRVIRESPVTTRTEPSFTGFGASGVCRRRRTNEYVDSPSSLSSSSSTSHVSGKPSTSATCTVDDSGSPRRLFLFVSTPCSTRSSSSSSTASAASASTGSRRTLATISPTTTFSDPVDIRRGAMTSSMSLSQSRSINAAVELSSVDHKTGIGVRRLHHENEHLSCSFCCGGSCASDNGSSDDDRTWNGCRSLLAALCLPGLWLVRRAKASYQRRVRHRSHHVTTVGASEAGSEATISGDKRLIGGDVIECSRPSTSVDVIVTSVT